MKIKTRDLKHTSNQILSEKIKNLQSSADQRKSHPEEIAVLSINTANTGLPKFIKQMVLDKSQIIPTQ